MSILCTWACACGDGRGELDSVALDVATAPRVVIDRFNERSGTLYHRVGDPIHPDPNEPIDFDDEFREQAFGPSGEIVIYYDFDVKPRTVEPMVVLVDETGAPILDQLPIVDLLPDSNGYSDYWRMYTARAPADYRPNTITSIAGLEHAGLTMSRTDVVVNRPLVPEGTTAALRLDPALPISPQAVWYRDQVAFYLDFGAAEQPEEAVPMVDKYVTYNDNEAGPASNRKTEPDGVQTHHIFASLPEWDGISPLWHIIVYDNADFDSVHDLASAQEATILDPDLWIMNNPIVSIE